MSTIFDAPHIFIVFPAGAGGNFISSVVLNIVAGTFNNIALSSTGNAHSNSTSKLDFSDIMSCGTRYSIPKFDNFEEKLKFYRTEIEAKHGSDTDVKVSWTHDFTNIQLYKKLFPNCKILAVTTESDKEKLAVVIQQELKNRLDPMGFVFFNCDPYLERWLMILQQILISFLGVDSATDITNNYLDAKFRPIVKFVAIIIMLKFYDQEYLVDPAKKMNFDYLNYSTIASFIAAPESGNRTQLCIGPSFRECLTDDCVIMPYSVLMDNNLPDFLAVVERLIGTSLDNNQLSWVQYNFQEYYNKQAPLLMEDPGKYFCNVSTKAKEQMASIKAAMLPS